MANTSEELYIEGQASHKEGDLSATIELDSEGSIIYNNLGLVLEEKKELKKSTS